jgi:polysaccharide pyruvyl transferase WcaK-like protein
MQANHPDVTLDALCTGPEVVAERYGISAARLRWYDSQRPRTSPTGGRVRKGVELGVGMAIDAIRIAAWVRRHNAVIVPGMGVLESTVPMRPWSTPYSMFLLGAFGRMFRTNVALVSVGTNVIDERLTRWLVTSAARLAGYRSYRDAVSQDAMERMGLDTSRDQVFPDVVFSLPTPAQPACGATSVGVGVMDYCGANGDRAHADEIRSSYVDKVSAFALWLVDNDFSVRLFTSDAVADDRIVQTILTKVATERPELGASRLLADPVPDLDELMRQTASVATVVATRYHNVLYALKLGKPTVSLSYAAKCDELMAGMGLSRFCQPVKSLDIARLIEQFRELQSRASELQAELLERSHAKARLVDEQFAELSATLFAPAKVAPIRRQDKSVSAGLGRRNGVHKRPGGAGPQPSPPSFPLAAHAHKERS